MSQATLKQKDVEFSNKYNPVELDTVVANKFGLPYGEIKNNMSFR